MPLPPRAVLRHRGCILRNHRATERDCPAAGYAALHNGEPRVARKFLYIVAVLIVLAIAATFAYRIWGIQFVRQAMIPGVRFESQAALPKDSYARPQMWLARPDIADNPASWTPAGFEAAKA